MFSERCFADSSLRLATEVNPFRSTKNARKQQCFQTFWCFPPLRILATLFTHHSEKHRLENTVCYPLDGGRPQRGGYKFGRVCSYMAGHYPGILMTGHIGTNTPKFVPPRWGRPPFDPTQTGLCKFGCVWSALKEEYQGGSRLMIALSEHNGLLYPQTQTSHSCQTDLKYLPCITCSTPSCGRPPPQ